MTSHPLRLVIGSLLLLLAVLAGASDLPVDAGAFKSDGEAWKAWAAVQGMEPYANEWQPTWTHPVKKEVVASTLSASLATLGKSAAANERNLELQLATGIAARFAHNLDVEGAADLGPAVLRKAKERFPSEPRPGWQLGTSLCETMHVDQGMTELLAVERLALPVEFWRDYARCAYLNTMFKHTLMALAVVGREGPLTQSEALMAGKSRELRPAADPASDLEAKDSWHVERGGATDLFQSWPCGFQVKLPATRAPRLFPVRKGMCVAQVVLGPYPTPLGPVSPSVNVIARAAKGGETIDQFVGDFTEGKGSTLALTCGAAPCRSLVVTMPGSYVAQGGGLFIIEARERPAPEFPGLIFEHPMLLPKDGEPKDAKPGLTFLRPTTRLTRFPGRIFYVIALDTTVSVADQARVEYQRILADVVIE